MIVIKEGNKAWGKRGIGISSMSSLPASLFTGETFDLDIAVILPKDANLILPIWAFCKQLIILMK